MKRGFAQTLGFAGAVLGAWLAISAFALPHARGHAIHDAILGLVIVAFALGGIYVRRSLRHANAVVAFGLAASLLVFRPVAQVTAANVLLVVIVLFCVAVVPAPWIALAGRGARER